MTAASESNSGNEPNGSYMTYLRGKRNGVNSQTALEDIRGLLWHAGQRVSQKFVGASFAGPTSNCHRMPVTQTGFDHGVFKRQSRPEAAWCHPSMPAGPRTSSHGPALRLTPLTVLPCVRCSDTAEQADKCIKAFF